MVSFILCIGQLVFALETKRREVQKTETGLAKLDPIKQVECIFHANGPITAQKDEGNRSQGRISSKLVKQIRICVS